VYGTNKKISCSKDPYFLLDHFWISHGKRIYIWDPSWNNAIRILSTPFYTTPVILCHFVRRQRKNAFAGFCDSFVKYCYVLNTFRIFLNNFRIFWMFPIWIPGSESTNYKIQTPVFLLCFDPNDHCDNIIYPILGSKRTQDLQHLDDLFGRILQKQWISKKGSVRVCSNFF